MKISTILAASALTLVAAQASAVTYDISGTGSNSNSKTAYANTTNTFSGTAELVGTTMTATMTQTSNGGFLVLEQTRIFDVLSGFGSNEITSCGGSGATLACGSVPLGTSPWGGAVSGSYVTDFLYIEDIGSADPSTVNQLTITEQIVYTQAVPVPAAAWLFGSALVGLAGIGRKRK
jgi:hypothetical protein